LTFAEVDGNFTALNNELAEKALAARTISAGTGLTGGGDLSTNRTLSLNSTTTASLGLADTSVQPARQVATGAGLTGGGDLSTNRTLSIADSGVTTAKIGDSQVTTAKIGDSQVTTAKINALAVTDAKLAAGAVVTAKIGDNQVTAAKLATLARGRVLQVVEGVASTQYETTSTTYGDTGLSATITPLSSTSKILVSVNQNFYCYQASATSAGMGPGIRVMRGSTAIFEPVADPFGPYDVHLFVSGTVAIELGGRWSFMMLDSPGTTSAVTYKTQARPYNNTNGQGLLLNTEGSSSSVSKAYIHLIEVAV
jgi:hypothetical protein